VHPNQATEIFSNVLRHLICWSSDDIQVKFDRDRPRGTLLGELKPNIAILDLYEDISQKLCKIGGKLLLMTNRKSHMSF